MSLHPTLSTRLGSTALLNSAKPANTQSPSALKYEETPPELQPAPELKSGGFFLIPLFGLVAHACGAICGLAATVCSCCCVAGAVIGGGLLAATTMLKK